MRTWMLFSPYRVLKSSARNLRPGQSNSCSRCGTWHMEKSFMLQTRTGTSLGSYKENDRTITTRYNKALPTEGFSFSQRIFISNDPEPSGIRVWYISSVHSSNHDSDRVSPNIPALRHNDCRAMSIRDRSKLLRHTTPDRERQLKSLR